MELNKLTLAMMAASSLILTACGGGSDSGSPSGNDDGNTPSTETATLSGTAATGLAMDGTVFVYDAEGRSTNVVIEDDGSYSVNVEGMTPPFMLEARPDDTSLAIQYSFAEAADITVNVTPLTTLALFIANDQQSLAAMVAAWDDQAEGFDQAALAEAEATIRANFADQFEEQGIDAETYDLFNSIFNADQTGFDAVLDDVKIAFNMDGGTFEVDVDEADYNFDSEAEFEEDDGGNSGTTDTTPDNFTFTASNDASLSTVMESNTVTLSGFDGELTLTVSNGNLILNGSETTSPAQVSAGDTVQVFHTSSSDFATTVTTSVTLGSVSASYRSTTRTADTTPDNVSFTSQTDVEPSTSVTSNTATLAGFEGTLPLSVTNGSLLVNGTASGTSATVSAGDQIQILQTSSSDFSTPVVSSVSLGTATATFTTTTRAADTTPNNISFVSLTDVEPSTSVTSSTATLAGFEGTLPLSVTNGSLLVNGSASGTSATVSAGDQIQIVQTSSSEFSTPVVSSISLGTATATFTTTTRAADTTPDNISFVSLTDAEPSTSITSDAVTLAGFDGELTLSVTNGSLLVNGSASGTSATVSAGDQIKIVQTSSSEFSTPVVSSISLGTATATFTTTTRAEDTTPDSFGFTDQTDVAPGTQITSNTVTLSGFEDEKTISVNFGTLLLNGVDVGTSATVESGDEIQVTHVSSVNLTETHTSTVTLGDINANFNSTTTSVDSIPDSFSFVAKTDVEPSSTVLSDTETLSGFDGELTMSVSNGSLVVNGSAVGASTQVEAGDQVQVQHTSASTMETDVTSTVTLGSLREDFVSTTRAADTTPDPVVFTPITNASRGNYNYSNTVTLTGFDGDATISISNGNYDLDGSNQWISRNENVPAGTQIRLQATASNNYGTTTNVVLTVNGTPFTFSVTTPDAPTPALGTPYSHYIDGQIVDPGYVNTSEEEWAQAKNKVPEEVLIEVRYNIDFAVVGTPVNVYNGEYSINYSNVWHQGTATSATDIGSYSHTVTSDDVVRVRHTSASNDRETVETTLILGGAMGAGIDTASFSTRTYDVDFFKVPVVDSTWSVGADDVGGLEVPIGYEQSDFTDDFPIYTLKSTASGTTLMKGQMTSNSGTIDQVAVSGFGSNVTGEDLTAVKVSDTETLLFGCNNVNTTANVYVALESATNAGMNLALTNYTDLEITSCQNLAITDLVWNGNDMSFTLVAAGEGTNNGSSGYLISTIDFNYYGSAGGTLSNRVDTTYPSLLTLVSTTDRTVQAMAAIDSNQVVYAVSQPLETMWGTSALYLYKGDTGATQQLIGSGVEPFNNWSGVTWIVDDIYVWNKPSDPQIYLVSGNRGVIKVDADNRNLSNYSRLSGGSTCIDGITAIPNDSKITLYCHDRDGDPSHIINFENN